MPRIGGICEIETSGDDECQHVPTDRKVFKREMNRTLRVLLVDDHATVRQGLRALFQSVPSVDIVHDVADGRSAMESIRIIGPDVVVLDLLMASVDGLTVMRELSEWRRRPRIVVLTRYRDARYVREALAAGASGYVLKQSPFSELRSAVEAAGLGDQHLDPALWQVVSQPQGPIKAAVAFSQPSARELEVLRATALGRGLQEIAASLTISVKTVGLHKANGMKKLGLRDRVQLVRYAILNDWLQED